MSRPLTPGGPTEVKAAKSALEHLIQARDLAKIAGASKLVARINAAITSAGGAVRHAEGRALRTVQEAHDRVRGPDVPGTSTGPLYGPESHPGDEDAPGAFL
jgi:hypothetical protein